MKLSILLLTLVATSISVTAESRFSESDTLTVTGKTITVFGPTKEEYEALLATGGGEVDSLLDEFYYQVSVTIPHLAQQGLATTNSAHSLIRIVLDDKKRVDFERKEFGFIIGFILSDGKKEPAVVSGVDPPDSWLRKIVEFYNIK